MQLMQLTQTIRLSPMRQSKPNKTAMQPLLPGMQAEPVEKPPVTNRQIAEVLSNIADLLDFQQANPYRIQAYRNAARGILELEEPVAEILARHETLQVPGLGQRLRRRIAELVETGEMTFYNDLCLQFLPAGVRALMAIEFVGVKSAIRLYDELDIDTPEKLWNAANQQRIRKLYGFGPRSEARLREAVKQFMLKKRASEAPLGAA